VFIGGADIDSVTYSTSTQAVVASIGNGANDGAWNERDDIRADVEGITGSAGNDSLVGNSSANILIGGAGNDTLIGGAGNDTIDGGGGNDVVHGGEGDDALTGGVGNDALTGGAGLNTCSFPDGDLNFETCQSKEFSPNSPVRSIESGWFHTCVALESGEVNCWGINTFGQLGAGPISNTASAVRVPSISNALTVGAGASHSCALLANQTVQCWGLGGAGQLGQGAQIDSLVPVTVQGLTGATSLSVGKEHSCTVLDDRTIKCWGNNDTGQLGDGVDRRSTRSSVPVTVVGVSNATAVSAGGDHTCALLVDTTVACWGWNDLGTLGNDGSTGAVFSGTRGVNNVFTGTPVPVLNLAGVISVSAGDSHSCAVLAGGGVKCWGWDVYGQLGNGDVSSSGSFIPVDVVGITDAVSVSAGWASTCARLAGGDVKCWGWNQNGQLGDGSTVDSAVPVRASGWADNALIAVSNHQTCAVSSAGAARCLGWSPQSW
jgi:alpha-tubulin suppressor-like RCC1 family protein